MKKEVGNNRRGSKEQSRLKNIVLVAVILILIFISLIFVFSDNITGNFVNNINGANVNSITGNSIIDNIKSFFSGESSTMGESGVLCESNTYYIDFENGNDANAGNCTDSAWKHSPGDLNAEGIPRLFSQYGSGRVIRNGDKYKFKGGVTYRGAPKSFSYNPVQTNCDPNLTSSPVSYLGQTDWGTGKAVIDGSILIVNWTRCVSAAECAGNVNYSNIWYAYTTNETRNLSVLTTSMYQEEKPLFVSQTPNIPDPLLIDDVNSYLAIPAASVISNYDRSPNYTSIIDTRFDSFGGEKLIGSYIVLWIIPNEVGFYKILNYTSSLHRIDFEWINKSYLYADRDNKYSIINNIYSALDTPGEYYFNDTAERNGNHKVYLWALNNTNPNNEKIEISVYSSGLYNDGNCPILIDGFKIQKFRDGAILAYGKGTLRNNQVLFIGAPIPQSSAAIYLPSVNGDMLVENNYLYSIKKTRGISGTASIIRNNTLEKVDGTAIDVGAKNVTIVENKIINCNAVHSNGISAYGRDESNLLENIIIARNLIIDTLRPIAVSDARNITLYNNILKAQSGTPALTVRSNTSYISSINNVFVSRYPGNSITVFGFIKEGFVFKNNIVSFSVNQTGEISNNIYVGIGMYGANTNDMRFDLSGVFVRAPRFYESISTYPNSSLDNQNRIYIDSNNYSSIIKPGDIVIFKKDNIPRTVISVNSGYTGTYINLSSNINLTNYDFIEVWPVGTTNFTEDFHLQNSSPAIDAGVNVGLSYLGNAPDIGAYESNYSSSITREICGNNKIETNEICDGTNVSGYTCASVAAGFKSGSLSCNADCKSYNTSQCIVGNTIRALSCEQNHVQAAINSASDGDIVLVPSGSCVWSNAVIINKSIMLSGTGKNLTQISGLSGVPFTLLSIQPATDIPIRVTGFSFSSPDYMPYMVGYQIGIKINGITAGLNNVEIDNCRFTNGTDMLWIQGYTYPLIDNNEFADSVSSIRIIGQDSVSWARPIAAGTKNAVFVENNRFSYKYTPGSGAGTCAGADANVYQQEGTRLVYRYNTVTNLCQILYSIPIDGHGNQPNPGPLDMRGTIMNEVYGNTWNLWGSGGAVEVRGGSHLVYNNTLNCTYYYCLLNRFTEEEGWAEGGPWSVKPYNNGTWPAYDQIFNSFIWNNKRNGVDYNLVSLTMNTTNPLGSGKGNDDIFIQEGRDFFYHEPQASGGKESFPVSQGINMTFSSSGANAYYPYIPYVYPHPLSLIEPNVNLTIPTTNKVELLNKNGSVNNTFTNISACASKVSAGQTCLVYAGVYDEQITLIRSGNSSDPITLMANNRSTIITNMIRLQAQSYYIFKGIVFDGKNNALFGIYSNAGPMDSIKIIDSEIKGFNYTGIFLNFANYFEIINSSIHDNGDFSGTLDHGDGIQIFGNVSNGLISGCDIYNNQDDGISLAASNVFGKIKVINSTIHDNIRPVIGSAHPDGIELYCNNLEITGNVIYNHLQDLIGGGRNILIANNVIGARNISNNAYSVVCGGSDNISIINNVLHHSGYGAIRLNDGDSSFGYYRNCSNITIKNNIFHLIDTNYLTSPNYPIEAYDRPKLSYSSNNNLYFQLLGGTGTDIISWGSNGTHTKEWMCINTGNECSSITVDPMFVNSTSFNYRLTNSSPAIDAGVYVGFPYQGNAPDIGAYESNFSAQINPGTQTPFQIYIANNYAGNDNGYNCANAHSVSWFNNAANWNSLVNGSDNKIGPNDTVHLCGTISSSLIIQGSGIAGKPITILFEKDAKMSAPNWTGAWWGVMGAIQANNVNYIVLDGGQNGIVQATNATTNGQQVTSEGIMFNAVSNSEIKNLNINNMYVRTSNNDLNGSGFGIYVNGGTNNTIHNNQITEAFSGISYIYPGNAVVVNVQIYNNTINRTNWGIAFSSGNVNATADNISIYFNDIENGDIWDDPGDVYHHDGIFVYAVSAGDKITNLRIYNNYVHGNLGTPSHVTAWIYVEGYIYSPLVYNNLLISTIGGSSNGFVYINYYNSDDLGNASIFSNTMVALNTSAGLGLRINSNRSNINNNIFYNITNAIYVGDSGNYFSTNSNHNLFFGLNPNGDQLKLNGIYYSLSNWQSQLNLDSHSISGDPLFVNLSTNDFHLKNESSAIDAGVDLSAYFTTDIEGNPRPRGNAWDIGAYESNYSSLIQIVNNTYYVRGDAAGSNTGADWNNAYTTLPSVLKRNSTYYIGDGNYSSYTFDDAENGTQYIFIKKATITDHGTDSGWNNIYGDGQALFNNSCTPGAACISWRFTSGYFIVDGSRGFGKNISSYGFYLPSTNTTNWTNQWPVFMEKGSYSDMNNITIKHLAINCYGVGIDAEQIGFGYGTQTRKNWMSFGDFYINNCQNSLWLIGSNQVIEDGYFDGQTSTASHHGIHVVFLNNYNATLRNNYFNSCPTTGCIESQGLGVVPGLKIYNNIFKNITGGNGVVTATSCDYIVNTSIYNNIVIDSVSTIFRQNNAGCSINGSGNIVKNNLLYNSSVTIPLNGGGFVDHDYNWYSGSSNNNESHGIAAGSENPFVNLSTNDFHLKNESSAIDAGVDLGVYYNFDADGVTRPRGNAWDIGAYESNYSRTIIMQNTPADVNYNGCVNNTEFGNYLTKWVQGNVDSTNFTDATRAWISGGWCN